MTVEKGAPWGTTVDRPHDLVVVDSDAELATRLASATGGPVTVAGGDIARTLGNPDTVGRSTLLELPIDLLRVRLDGGAEIAGCAHVVARSPWRRGGWWRGPILLVMNSEFLGAWDVAPRGHPNDGRVETFEVDGSFGLRDRVAARPRMRSATHIPHPGITTRSVRSANWTFDVPLQVFVDGQSHGVATAIRVDVAADAAVVYA